MFTPSDRLYLNYRTCPVFGGQFKIIGEAAKNLSAELRAKYPVVPWKSMAGIRDRLIHNYFGVNLDIVWEVVTAELPEVVLQLERILEQEGG
jgi:uncharacterized protein with HEPN domain